jgi:multiple sugar transport system substrate-binding protein
MPDAGTNSTPKTLSRRTVLRFGGAALASAATGPFVFTPARAQGFNWKRFQGKELYLILSKHPWVEVLEKNMTEFESLTGMKVKWETLPEIQARQKLVVEMTSASGGVDGFFTSLHVEKKRFWKAGWYEPLNRFIQDRTLTPADWDWDDLAGGAKSIITQKDGSISALPAFVDAVILFYRKDLYAAKGLQPPKTHAEWEAQMKQLHNPPGLYGTVFRGLKNANATMFSNTQFVFGADFLTKDGKAALDTKETIAALDWYAGNLRRHGPPGVINFNWYECSASFMQGQAATYFDGINFANQFEDPAKSKIVGKVGYVVMPAGPSGSYSSLYGTGMAVSSQSRNKEAAYLLAQWATNKQNAARELLAGVGVARNSPWSNAEVKAKPKMPADWYQAYQDSLKIGRLGLPEIVGVTEYRDIIGVAIQKAIEGAPSAQVLAEAQKEFQDMLNKTEG